MHTKYDSMFHVYRTGKLTVIGFDGRQLNEPLAAVECRERLLRLLDQHDCELLVADLTNVEMISSWVLGILAAVTRRGIPVEVYHASAEIRDILSTTHLDELLHIRHGEFPCDADAPADGRWPRRTAS